MPMMSDDELEALWGGLLSREAGRVREAYATLAPEEQQAVLAHLRRMAEEAGWHKEQRLSAQAALEFLLHD